MLRYLLIELTKTRDALAAAAVSSAAMAQATISGTFNVDTQNTVANSETTVGMGDAIVSVSVSEDLGGGLKASANTTLQTKAGRGGNVTNNGYSFGLTGGFGGLTLRNYLVGNAEASAGISAEDDMNDSLGGYFVRTRLQYALPAIVPNLGIQLRWDKTADIKVAPKGDDTKINFDYTIGQGYISYGANLDDIGGGSAVYLGYNFGVANVDLALTNYDEKSYGTAKFAHTEDAVTAPLGANLSAGLHLQMGDLADATGVRLTYAMSKRTAVSFNYVDIAKSAVAPTKVGNNFRVRVSHKF